MRAVGTGTVAPITAWLVVVLLWFAWTLNYCDRQAIFSIFPVLRQELGFSNVELGLTGSVFLWMYGLCSPLAGHLADRVSKRGLIVASLVLWSVTVALTATASSSGQVLIWRGILAAVQCLYVPAAVALIAELHTAGSRARANALFCTGQLAGVATGGWLGGWLAQEVGWRSGYTLLGAFGILFALPFGLVLRRVPESRPAARNRAAASPLRLLKVPMFVILCCCFPAFMLLLWVLYTWLPDLLYEKFSLSLAEAGFYATVYVQGATALGLAAGGAASDFLYRRTKAARYWVLCLGILLGSPWVHLLGRAETLLLANVSAAAFGFGCGMVMANLMICSFEVIPPETRASAVATINFVGTPFSGTAALMGGLWKDRIGIPALMSGAALVAIVAAVVLAAAIWRQFPKDYRRAQQESLVNA